MANEGVIMPDDYKDYIYRLTYFLLGKIAHCIPKSISPNQITFAAFSCSMIACFFLVVVPDPSAFILWTVFNLLWYLLDALDGIHARLTHQTSEYGAYLDHFLDTGYFIFMLTAFAMRFQLFQPLYIFILLLRSTAATSVFLVQIHTGRLLLGRFSGGLELLLFSNCMILSYYFPHFDLSQHTSNPHLLYWIHALGLTSGVFMKVTLWLYIFGVPMTFWQQARFVKRYATDQA